LAIGAAEHLPAFDVVGILLQPRGQALDHALDLLVGGLRVVLEDDDAGVAHGEVDSERKRRYSYHSVRY
jgi:hypothetical protein